VCLDRLPLSTNGKIDRRALPEPTAADTARRRAYEAPENETERRLAAIWEAVLDRTDVGRADSFFDLGGDSLKAIQVVSRIHRDLGIDANLRDVFGHPTLAGLAQGLASRGIARVAGIARVDDAPHYPVSAGQRRLWVLSQIEHASAAYHIPIALSIAGPIDANAWRVAILHLVQRHEILRTTIDVVGGEPRQVVHDMHAFLAAHPDLPRQVDVAGDADPGGSALAFGRRESMQPFDLARGPLIRVTLVRTGAERHVLFVTLHHIVGDGWSLRVLTREFVQAYDAVRRGRTPALPALRWQYRDYAAWQERDAAAARSEDREYWRKMLAGPLPVLDLATDMPRPRVQTFHGRFHTARWTAEESAALRELARRHDATMFTLVTALVKVLLHRYTGAGDVIVGTPVAGRGGVHLEDQIGFYANTLALRSSVRPDEPFESFLSRTQATVADAVSHEGYPFDRLVDELDVPRALNRQPLFDVMVLLDVADPHALALPNLTVSLFPKTGRLYDVSKFDLTFAFGDDPAGLTAGIEYNSSLFEETRIAQMASHLHVVAQSVVDDARTAVGDLAVMPSDERQRLVEFNATATDVPARSVLERFGDHVRATPHRPALISDDARWTYAELDACADAIASHLSVAPQEIVGVACDDGQWCVPAILGVLKAGGAFLPMDAGWPRDRRRTLAADSRCRFVLVSRQAAAGEFGDGVTAIDVTLAAAARGPVPIASRPSLSNLAYVIYTSGSTGRPKGVAVEHRSLANYVWWAARQYVGDESVNWPVFTSPAFDLTLTSIFVPLTTGHAAIVYEGDAKASLDRILDAPDAAVVKLTPAHLHLVAGRDNRRSQVRRFVVGGENLTSDLCRRVQASFGRAVDIFNEYGPTEATVGCMVHRFDPHGDTRESVPLGVPAANTRIHLLDRLGHAVPSGGTGEIGIAGLGLAREYLNLPDATAARFVADPFMPGERLYRTGDLGRWRHDGTLEFIGRMDGQIKIRGHRVEPGEIEARLLGLPSVSLAVVVSRAVHHDHAELVAYVVCRPGDAPLTMASMREQLGALLPAAFIPSYLVVLDALPLTPHGKVDRAALPMPERAPTSQEEPATALERLVLDVWREVLKIDAIGVTDNFFELGGDSIKAIQISAALHRREQQATLTDLLSFPTVRAIAARLSPVTTLEAAPAVAGDVALTPIQRWFFDLRSPAPHHYNQAVMLHRTDGFDEATVRLVLDRLVEHHDALRLVFDGDRQIQQPAQQTSDRLAIRDFRFEVDQSACVADAAAALHRSLHLASGPLFKAELYQTADGAHLLLVAHHLVIDGVSWRILLDDFAAAYSQAIGGAIVQLAPRTASFAAWSARLQEIAGAASLRAEIPFWTRVDQAVRTSPVVSALSGLCVGEARQDSLVLDRQMTLALMRESHHAYGTDAQDLLLAALGRAVAIVFGTTRMPVLLEGHGREDVFADVDVSRTVGWFTTMYPVVLEDLAADIASTVTRTKETLRRVPNRGVGYGVLRHLTPADAGRPRVFEAWPGIRFNYLGQTSTALGAAALSISRVRPGEGVAPATPMQEPLDISCLVRDDELLIGMRWHPAVVRDEQAARLLDAWRVELVAVVDHCRGIERRVLTPSDVIGGEDLSADELDAIQRSIR
jgi:amino acid adenylation domain-containing protein/non-ribosomal peptide synthase protein (TIGR01720 family)